MKETEGRIRLRVMGLSYSQIQSGAYALILAQVGGSARIPVVIGAAEAHSIAIKMEGIVPPRPLTHDTFAAFTHAFGIQLVDVYIYRFEDGVFYSELTFRQGDTVMKIDARTSDAVAIAIRTGSPIFTNREVLDETAFELQGVESTEHDDEEPQTRHDPPVENYTIEQLEETLASLIDKEEYEEAARIKEIIEKKKNNL